MQVKLPYPPEADSGCINTTLPGAAAWIGVPDGTPMSMPGWQDSQARRSQKGEVIGPLTGQIIEPVPRRIGPALKAEPCWAARSCACTCACSFERLPSSFLRDDWMCDSTALRPL